MLIADQNYRPTGEVSVPSEMQGDVFWQLLELDFPVMPLSVVIRKQCFLSVGLLNRRIPGIDDWDILVRIAELFPGITSAEPVGIYRQPAPYSGQGSSVQSDHLACAANHQLELFELPRVKTLSKSQRQAIRRRTINRAADTLLWGAWKSLPQKNFGFAVANIATALRLNPFRAMRPAIVRRMGKTLSERLRARNSDSGGLTSPN